MNETILGNQLRKVPSIAVGCMRLSEKSCFAANSANTDSLQRRNFYYE